MLIDTCLPPVPHDVLRGPDDVTRVFTGAPERQWLADQLAGSVAAHEKWHLPGFCLVCESPQLFAGQTPSGSTVESPLLPNYREMLLCPSCQLNNRQRLAATTLKTALGRRSRRQTVYLHEQITPMFDWVVRRFGGEHEIIGSEFLGPDVEPGAVVDGVRHEDALALSLGSESVDAILSTDVLEHVPDIEPALREAVRVLRPEGAMIFSIPFHYTETTTVRRAELQPDGSVVHHRSPEFHGNPTRPDEGSLVFYDYGWDLMDLCKSCGFADAVGIGAWSLPHGIIGERFQTLFLAVKG